MDSIACHSPVTAEIGRRLTRERIEDRHRAELLASAAATIGRIDAWLATSGRVEHRATKAVWCGMCGDPYFPGCCAWSAGVFEHRAARPQQFTMVDGEVCEIEHRPGRIVSVR